MEDVSACTDDSERGVDELLGTAADYFSLEHPELQVMPLLQTSHLFNMG